MKKMFWEIILKRTKDHQWKCQIKEECNNSFGGGEIEMNTNREIDILKQIIVI